MFVCVCFVIFVIDLWVIVFILEYDFVFFSVFNFIGGNGDFSIFDNSIFGLVDISWYEIDLDNSVGGII